MNKKISKKEYMNLPENVKLNENEIMVEWVNGKVIGTHFSYFNLFDADLNLTRTVRSTENLEHFQLIEIVQNKNAGRKIGITHKVSDEYSLVEPAGLSLEQIKTIAKLFQ